MSRNDSFLQALPSLTTEHAQQLSSGWTVRLRTSVSSSIRPMGDGQNILAASIVLQKCTGGRQGGIASGVATRQHIASVPWLPLVPPMYAFCRYVWIFLDWGNEAIPNVHFKKLTQRFIKYLFVFLGISAN